MKRHQMLYMLQITPHMGRSENMRDSLIPVRKIAILLLLTSLTAR